MHGQLRKPARCFSTGLAAGQPDGSLSRAQPKTCRRKQLDGRLGDTPAYVTDATPPPSFLARIILVSSPSCSVTLWLPLRPVASSNIDEDAGAVRVKCTYWDDCVAQGWERDLTGPSHSLSWHLSSSSAIQALESKQESRVALVLRSRGTPASGGVLDGRWFFSESPMRSFLSVAAGACTTGTACRRFLGVFWWRGPCRSRIFSLLLLGGATSLTIRSSWLAC